jgi:PBSX family phage portal protein
MGTVKADILEVPKKAEGSSKQLDLARFNYDEHKCVTPPVDLQLLAQLYDRNVPHKACVDAKVINTVGLGWELEPAPGEDEHDDALRDLMEEVAAWLDELAERDEEKAFSDLLEAVRLDEEAVGFGALEISRNGSGRIDGLYHVHAFTLRRRKDRDGWVQKVDGDYRYFRNYRLAVEDTADPERFADSNELLIFGRPSPSSPFYPLPDHVPAMGSMAGDEAAERYQLQFFTNNAVPRLAIVVEGGKLDADTKEYLLTYLQEGIRGEAHKTLLLESSAGDQVKIHLEKLTVGEREDAAFMEYRRFNVGQVLMAHRVSPSKVTIVENANLANSKDQDKTFKEQVCKPAQERWERKIQRLLVHELGPDLPLRFCFREMDLADEEQIARTRTHYMPALTNNEVRSMIDVGPAGIDQETGDISDPLLEEWGRAPFEAPAPTSGVSGLSEELIDKRRIRPEHEAFVREVARLGVLVQEIREGAEAAGDREGY